MTNSPEQPGSKHIAPQATHAAIGRPQTMTEAERRQQILNAATCIFSHKGYRAATMDEVSRHARMSKKTVYQLFASKAEIFDVLLKNWALPFNLPFEQEGRPQREVLSEGLCRLAHLALDEVQIAISRVLIAEAARPGEVADALDELGVGRGYWSLERWLSTQTTLGRYPVGNPVELAAMIFHAVAGDAIIHLLLRIRPRPSDAELSARIERVVGMYFDEPR